MSSPSSNDFSSGALDPVWTVSGPSDIAASLATSETDAFLELVTPDGNFDAWNTNNAARVMQAISNDDFTLETRFLSTPSEQFQLQGILVEQDAQNWLRFDTYSDGFALYAFIAVTVNGISSPGLQVAIPDGAAEYLRVTRQGDLWTYDYSGNGQIWTTAGSITHDLTATSAGVLAGNVGNATGFTAQVDYIEFDSDPITNEDGDFQPVNSAPVASDDTLITSADAALTFSAADLLANDSDSNGDALSIAAISQPANGTLTDNPDGTYTYTPATGFSGTDTFTYTVSDGNLLDEATVTLRPIIDVWYDDTQTFGSPGEAQTWVNILGNVPDDVVSLSYSLNGGPASPLSIGSDTRRLHDTGDFNVELAYSELDGTSTNDVVTIIANLTNGSTLTRNVTIEYEDGLIWDDDYSIDWSSVDNIQDVAQIVDGKWVLENGGVRIAQPGYDRVLAIGDSTWDNYEVRLSVTTHDLLNIDPSGRDGGGFAIGMLWTGHTDNPIPGFQPHVGWEPGAAFFYTNNDGFGGGQLTLHPSTNFFASLASQGMTLNEDTTYNLAIRVEQSGLYDRDYSLKIWEAGTAEPGAWTMTGTQTFSLNEAPATGGIYLNAHYHDVTFNDLTVTEIEGDDIIQGTAADDILIAVDPGALNPGQGELDVLVGNDGADQFVLGSAAAVFYDDGNVLTSGTDDYAFLYDFLVQEDTIQLSGTAADYQLASDAVGLPGGTSIWLTETGSETDELIAVVNNVYGLNLDGTEFFYI